MLARFQPSGRSSLRLVVALVPATMVALVLASPYQQVVSAVATFDAKGGALAAMVAAAFGGVLGSLSWWTARLGKCRNRTLGLAIGLGLALAALAATHALAFQHAAAIAPGLSFADYASWCSATGLGRFDRSLAPVLSAVLVGAIWIGEAATVLGIAGACGRAAASQPFCEHCEHWAVAELCGVVRSPGRRAVAAIRNASDIGPLLDLRADVADEGGVLGKDTLAYRICCCTSCGGMSTLTIEIDASQIDAHGREHTLHETLQESLLLTRDDSQAVIELVRTMPTSPALIPLTR